MARFVYLILVLIFSNLVLSAQDKKLSLIIHQIDGTEIRYPAENVDSVTVDNVDANFSAPSEITVKKVYGDGRTYCAFTTLVKRESTYYLAFREGDTHVADGDYGKIKILYSSDGDKWELYQIISLDQIDLRDPNLSVMPDGKLLLLCGARMLSDNGSYVTRTYYAKEMDNGFGIPALANLPQEINWDACSWVWRLTWYDGVGYGVCYGGESPALVKTTDGYNYELISYLSIPGTPSECRVRFQDDGTAVMIVRREQGSTSIKGYMGMAEPPYMNWEWKELNVSIAGEDFLIDGNKVVIATRMTQNIGSWTAAWFGDINGNFNWCYTFPYGCTAFRGDTGYAGMLNEEKEYWISYFAIDKGDKPSVFLVRIPKSILSF